MIRNVVNIHYRRIGDDSSEWKILPIIPASGTFQREDKSTDDGRVAEFNISANLYEEPRDLSDDLRIAVEFDDDTVIHLGTEYFPFRFNISEKSVIGISAKYVIPVSALTVL